MKKIEDYTIIELKALAYDQIQTLETAQNNLKTINQELTKRFQDLQKPEIKQEDAE